MIILYITEENIFVIIFYKLLVQEIRKSHIQDCFKVNGKQWIILPKKDEYVKFKNHEREMKSPFIIYVNFQSILASENNKKQNREESITNIENILLAVMNIT